VPLCPDCGSRESIPIVYGLPGEQLYDASHRGEVVLGGCVIWDGNPQWSCPVCGRHFRKANR
jgi:hypothetical protein